MPGEVAEARSGPWLGSKGPQQAPGPQEWGGAQRSSARVDLTIRMDATESSHPGSYPCTLIVLSTPTLSSQALQPG